jgi:hypothetical protein
MAQAIVLKGTATGPARLVLRSASGWRNVRDLRPASEGHGGGADVVDGEPRGEP